MQNLQTDALTVFEELKRSVVLSGFSAKQCKIRGGWIANLFTLGQTVLCKSGIVVSLDQLHGRIIRKCSLNQNLSISGGAPGAAGYLLQLLEHIFWCAEVGTEKALIRINYANQRDRRKIMTFGN